MSPFDIVLLLAVSGLIIKAVVQTLRGNTGSCGGDCSKCMSNCRIDKKNE